MINLENRLRKDLTLKLSYLIIFLSYLMFGIETVLQMSQELKG